MCVCICLIFSVSQGALFLLICPFVAVLWKVCPCLFIFTFHVFCCYNMNVNNFNIIDFTISKVHQMKLEHKTYLFLFRLATRLFGQAVQNCLNIFVRLRSKIVIFTIQGKVMILILDGNSQACRKTGLLKIISNV